MPRRAATLLLPALVLLAGCGDARIAVPSLSQPAGPTGFHSVGFPAAQVELLLPRNWTVLGAPRAPLVDVVSSGPAVIDLWRYPGAEVPPAGTTELTAARNALLAGARARDARLQVIRSSLVKVDGEGAVELDVLQRLNGQLRRVRSMHVYLPGEEVVLEEYAPPALFHTVDHTVFSPVRRSLHLLPGSSS